MKPRIYKRGNHWYCRRFGTSDLTGWGAGALDAYSSWFRKNMMPEAIMKAAHE